ncbi:hypothetical protein GGR58DRAFT_434129 [Xylaria digitata]|nr:hypothetical protein GGR58DRAFT_434129 [Xylaria digitata]
MSNCIRPIAMELSVESIVAIIGLLVAFPPAIPIIWHCVKRCRLQRKGLPAFFKTSDKLDLKSRQFTASDLDDGPRQSTLPSHTSSISISYEACIATGQGNSKQCVGLHNSVSLQNLRQFERAGI